MILVGFCLLVALIWLFCIIGLIFYGRRNYGILDNCGFPVIPPTLCLGSDPNFYKDVLHLKEIERFNQYGPIWGLYFGQIPQVFIADPELIRLIFVKGHESFHSRRDVDMGSPVLNEILTYLPGEKWKTVRTILSPLFTTAKLKTMTDVMAAHAQEHVEDLRLECGQKGRMKYNCKVRLVAWLIDMFTQTTLGVKLQNRKDPENEFATAFRKTMGEDMVYGRLYSLTMSFPFLISIAPTYPDGPTKLIESTIRHILQSRRQGGAPAQKATDFVDLLNEIHAKVGSEEYRKLGITDMTVVAQAVSFFLGGYETSSATLSHFFYFMAHHPEIQESVYNEIVSKFGTGGATTDYERIKEENMPLLGACLSETLRLAPPFKPERICNRDWTDGNIRIRKGTEVYIAPWAVGRNPELFVDPEKFDPTRFLPENSSGINTYAVVAFGHGPRNCIGARFALDSIKTFLVHFMRAFRLELRDDTVLNYKRGSTFIVTFDPLYLDVVERQGKL